MSPKNLVTGEIPIFVWSGRPYFHARDIYHGLECFSQISEERMTYHEKYFKLPEDHEWSICPYKLFPDGPDSEEEILKSGFVRMIFSAKECLGFKHRI